MPQLMPCASSLSHTHPLSFCSSTTTLMLPSSFFRRRRSMDTLRCSASEKPLDDAVELPLFPLPLVLFPGAILPLQIFEFRYRIMMHTLLHTDLRFGVIYNDAVSGTAEVGCVGEVVKHERLVDDRFFLVCKVLERHFIFQLLYFSSIN